jgi:hypothetical protein
MMLGISVTALSMSARAAFRSFLSFDPGSYESCRTESVSLCKNLHFADIPHRRWLARDTELLAFWSRRDEWLIAVAMEMDRQKGLLIASIPCTTGAIYSEKVLVYRDDPDCGSCCLYIAKPSDRSYRPTTTTATNALLPRIHDAQPDRPLQTRLTVA